MQLAAIQEQGFGWKSESALSTGNFYSFVTKQSYAGSGYVYYMDVDEGGSFADQLAHLKSSTWVDFGTRLVSQDFTLYNPEIDMLVWGSHTSEFLPSGDVVPTFHYRVYDEWKYLRVWTGEEVDSDVWALIVCEALMYLYAVTHLLEEMKELFFWGRKKYFASWMNIGELFNLLIFFNVFAFRYSAMLELQAVVEREEFGKDGEFVDLRQFGIYR